MNTFDFFNQICKIPRESGNEEGMRQYLLSWAKENGFDAVRDASGNIVIYCPATKGFEDKEPVCLQGHMDMVCVKEDGCNHDFTKDPIEVYQDGDFLRAKGTSLGGDNGIAIAMTMALFTDKECKHGPLEALFTWSEETGMNGAFGLDPSNIHSRRLINLDSEEEGYIYIGCAGGADLVASMPVSREKTPSGFKFCEISISGLKGGHSGAEIHLQRLNAIKAVARLCNTCSDFRICCFEGGTRRNVIPSSAKCVIAIPENEDISVIEKEAEVIREENKYEEPGFEFSIKTFKSCCSNAECINKTDSIRFVKLIQALDHGVHTYSKAVEGIVETSINLAIANTKEDSIEIIMCCRSLVESAKYDFVNKNKYIFEAFGCSTEVGGEYASWTPDPTSKLAGFCAKAWKDKTGKDAIVTSMHAGLECGVINSLVEGMDSVSMGPDLADVHSVKEHLSISSVERMYGFMKHLLEIC